MKQESEPFSWLYGNTPQRDSVWVCTKCGTPNFKRRGGFWASTGNHTSVGARECMFCFQARVVGHAQAMLPTRRGRRRA